MEGSPFVSDAGPGFDPEAAAAGAEEVRADQEAEQRQDGIAAFGLPEVTEEQVRQALFVGGDGLHAAFGVGDYDWVATERDLDRITPPLTRIINRYEAAKAIAGYSDELALAMGVGLWGWRSLLERVAVIRQQEAAGEVPRTRPVPQAGPAPAPPAPQAPPPPAWPEAAPPSPAPQAPPGVGGDHFPGAGAPREAPAAQIEVVGGYVTRAERIRQARERSPDAIPRQAPPPAQ